MGTITYALPQSGLPNASEDPKVATALNALLTLVNGHIDTANFDPAAKVVAAGAWQPLVLPTGVVAGGIGTYTPSARLEGDIVRLKGMLLNSGGSIALGATWATLPVGLRPSGTEFVSVALEEIGPPGNVAVKWQILPSGVISLTSVAIANSTVALSGVTFTLS